MDSFPSAENEDASMDVVENQPSPNAGDAGTVESPTEMVSQPSPACTDGAFSFLFLCKWCAQLHWCL